MGNRAVISYENEKTGIYLHWDGGVESVLAFLNAAKDLNVRAPNEDPSYSLARLTQIISNYLGGTSGIGIGLIDKLDADNGDNGLYIVGKNWEIIDRKHSRYTENSVDNLSEEDRERYKEIYNEVMEKNEKLLKNRSF